MASSTNSGNTLDLAVVTTINSECASDLVGATTINSECASHLTGATTINFECASHLPGAFSTNYGCASDIAGATTIISGCASHLAGASTINSGCASHLTGPSTLNSECASHLAGASSINSECASHLAGASSTNYGYKSAETSKTSYEFTSDTDATYFSLREDPLINSDTSCQTNKYSPFATNSKKFDEMKIRISFVYEHILDFEYRTILNEFKILVLNENEIRRLSHDLRDVFERYLIINISNLDARLKRLVAVIEEIDDLRKLLKYFEDTDRRKEEECRLNKFRQMSLFYRKLIEQRRKLKMDYFQFFCKVK
ncbi:hypothetical protein CDAR_305241 [Caerostris darwini]|nr:hypothetical protein CDAR_305241 [Caerostris darwini]